MGGSRTLTFSELEWSVLDIRRSALRSARATARKSYCLVTIKEKTRFGTFVRATVDGRFWLMNPKDFEEDKPPESTAASSAARRELGLSVKAPSFLF